MLQIQCVLRPLSVLGGTRNCAYMDLCATLTGGKERGKK